MPQRVAATGDAINDTVSLGAPSQVSPRMLSQSELDALRARLAQLWNPPAGAANPEELVVRIRIQLKPDGTLAGAAHGSDQWTSVRCSSRRATAPRAPSCAVNRSTCSRPEHYEQWKDIEITFDPRDMIGG